MTQKEQLDILEEWLKQYKGLLFKVVRAYASADQDDLFQEVIIQVWHSIPAYRKESSVSTWLYRIALNTAIKWTKKEIKYSGYPKGYDYWYNSALRPLGPEGFQVRIPISRTNRENVVAKIVSRKLLSR